MIGDIVMVNEYQLEQLPHVFEEADVGAVGVCCDDNCWFFGDKYFMSTNTKHRPETIDFDEAIAREVNKEMNKLYSNKWYDNGN